MDYKVFVTPEAEEELNRYIQHLLFEKENEQAAKNVLDDFPYPSCLILGQASNKYLHVCASINDGLMYIITSYIVSAQ